MPEPQRKRTFERAERKYEIMGELGTDLMLICSNVRRFRWAGSRSRGRRFPRARRLAARHGVRVGYKHWPGAVMSTTIAMPGKSCAVPITRISVSFSTVSTRCRARSTRIRSAPSPRQELHRAACDAPLFDMDLLYWSRHFRNNAGRGRPAGRGFHARSRRNRL